MRALILAVGVCILAVAAISFHTYKAPGAIRFEYDPADTMRNSPEEISTWYYGIVDSFAEVPALKPMVKKALEDGKVSEAEFIAISHANDRLVEQEDAQERRDIANNIKDRLSN
jgi:hypothetical protein